MSESRGPHQTPHHERIAEAAREAAVETAREEAAEMARELAADLLASADPVTQAINAEIVSFNPPLSPQAKDALANLLRLHYSLSGPQRPLETSGGFSRPVFPATPPRTVGR